LTIANSLEYGLSSYVFSRSTTHARAIADQLEAGSVVINDVHSDIASPEVPFGGIKSSGFGRIHGAEGFYSMSYIKHVSVNRTRLPARSPFWFPYERKDFRRGLAALRLLFAGRGPLGRLSKWL
jgi:succinate-semialdehyde dehydrogenase/glutarate-semialdehyde dehydrogenase